MACKSLYYGLFNFRNELRKLYAYAYTEKQAKIVMARRLAKQQEVLPVIVLKWLKEHPNSFRIVTETEWRETEDV
jgi:hypothetical protein